MFEQAELRGTPMGLMVRLMQKKGLNRHRNRYIRKPGFGSFWSFWAKHAIFLLAIFGPFPRRDGPPERKFQFESGLNHRDEAKFAVLLV